MQRKRYLGIAAAALAVLFAFSTAESASAATLGPTYKVQSASATYKSCVNHTSGGTAVGGAVVGSFVANSNGGGTCSASYLEVVYVNTSGNEVAKYATKYWGQGADMCGASCAQIILPRSSYKRIVEVLTSSTYSGPGGGSTPGIILYY